MTVGGLTEAQLGYVAGIMDGEGYIGLFKVKSHLKPIVGIDNTNLDMLEVINHWFGGHLCVKKSTSKVLYALRWQKLSDILNLLTAIEPYLIVKEPHAQLLIAWCLYHRDGDWSREDEMLSSLKVFNA